MKAIYKRELKAFFHSFVGWLFLAVTLFMMGIYFTVYNMMSGYPTISYVLQSIAFLFIISLPILTMRVMAEERKYKTDQLILTAPVTVGKVVLGKYLALVTVLAVPTVMINAGRRFPDRYFLRFFGRIFPVWLSGTCNRPALLLLNGECSNCGGIECCSPLSWIYYVGTVQYYIRIRYGSFC